MHIYRAWEKRNPHLLAEVVSWATCTPGRCGDGVAVDACLGLLEAEDLAA